MVTKSFKGISPTGGAGTSATAVVVSSLQEEEGSMNDSNEATPSTMPPPVAVSILLRAESGRSGVDMNNNFYSQGLGAGTTHTTATTTARAHTITTNTSNKSNNDGGHAEQHEIASKPVAAPSVATGTQINNILVNAGHIKRTKKLAKPRTKLSRARKLPTKKNRLTNASPGGESTPSKKPRANAKSGRKPTNKNQSKKRSAKAKPHPPSSTGEPPKKRGRPKKLKPEGQTACNAGTTKNKMILPKQPGGGEPFSKKPPQETTIVGRKKKKQGDAIPSTITSYSDIESVVSAVVDVVTDEIQHCSSMFAAMKRPTVVINTDEGLPGEEMPSAAKPRNSLSKSPPNKTFQDRNESTSKDGYSISISEEGDIHAVKRASAHLTQPSKASAKTTNQKVDTTPTASKAHSPQAGPVDAKPDYDYEESDVTTVVMAVKRFALEVYCPFLLSAKKIRGNDSPNIDRIRLSTLLAIREMLTMNAEKLFTVSSLNLNGSPISTRERNYLSHIFANAIIRNTAKRLHYSGQPGSHFLTDFIQATSRYDAKSDEFQFALERADVRSVYVRSNNERVGHEESTLAKVSFNYARAKHPLLRDGEFTLKDGPKEMLVEKARSITLSQTQPTASACAVFHIERNPDEAKVDGDDDDDDSDAVLESLKRALRSKQAQMG